MPAHRDGFAARAVGLHPIPFGAIQQTLLPPGIVSGPIWAKATTARVSDSQLLSDIEHRTFYFYWKRVNHSNGLQKDFGFNTYSTFTGKADRKFTHKNHFYLVGSDFNQTRQVVLNRTITFQGQTFEAGTTVKANLDAPEIAPGYEYDIIRRKRGHLGVGVQVDLFDASASISAAAQVTGDGAHQVAATASGSLLAPIPVAGPDFRLYLFEKAVAASDRPESTQPLRPMVEPADPIPSGHVTQSNGRTPAIAPIPVRASITEYTRHELQTLLQWVQSDGKLRTNDELVDEMFAALPFARRGSKIEAALRRAVTGE